MTQIQKRIESLSRPRRSTKELADDLQLLADRWEALGEQLGIFKQFISIKIIGVFESMLRDSIKRLVDAKPEYCQKAVANLQGTSIKDISDLLYKLVIGERTMGDIISIVYNCSSLEDIISCFTKITGKEFKIQIGNTSESWVDDDEMRSPIIRDIDETFRVISEMFAFRHNVTHESPAVPKIINKDGDVMLDAETISNMFAHSIIFAKALDWFVSNDVDGPRIKSAA